MSHLTEHADVSSDATCKEALPQTGWEGLLFFYFSFCAVARWGATFGAFGGIGRGGLRLPSGVLQEPGAPAPTDARRGAAPPGASRQTWLLAPPHGWAYPAHTRGSFRFTTKGTKGVPGALPLDPVGGLLSSPQRRKRRSPQKGYAALTQRDLPL